jgi:uncharacterized membrane protein (DUF2068 family)
VVAPNTDRGVRWIVNYKCAKALLQLLTAALLAVALAAGLTVHLHDLAIGLRRNAASGWSVVLAKLLTSASKGHALPWATLALLLDGILSAVEGWALHTGRRFGPWLVVIATSAAIPVELYEIIRHPRLLRIVICLLNIAIVAYLTARVLGRGARAKHDRAWPVVVS